MTKSTPLPDPDLTTKPDQTPKKQDQKSTTAKPATDEIGGPKGPEPTRFGDWEQKGRCSDF